MRVSPARARSLAAAAVRETFEETGLALGLRAPAVNGRVTARVAGLPRDRGGAPALDRLDYIYRAVTPPGLPRRFNARFFLARADDAVGTLGGNGELLDLGWVPVPEAMDLPIPYITAVVLEELEHMYDSPPDPDRDRPVPVCIRVGRSSATRSRLHGQRVAPRLIAHGPPSCRRPARSAPAVVPAAVSEKGAEA